MGATEQPEQYLAWALEHLNKFREAQIKIERHEKAVLAKVRKNRKRVRFQTTDMRETPDEYFLAKELETDFWYKRLVSIRNGHQLAANTLLLAVSAIQAVRNVQT